MAVYCLTFPYTVLTGVCLQNCPLLETSLWGRWKSGNWTFYFFSSSFRPKGKSKRKIQCFRCGFLLFLYRKANAPSFSPCGFRPFQGAYNRLGISHGPSPFCHGLCGTWQLRRGLQGAQQILSGHPHLLRPLQVQWVLSLQKQIPGEDRVMVRDYKSKPNIDQNQQAWSLHQIALAQLL